MAETKAAKSKGSPKGQTPLMRQYFRIKDRHPGTILLFRMGDFYETFGEDARTLHEVLGITLTKRSNGKAADVPLAGFPHHAVDSYLPRLVAAGLRVAICEQLEDPKQAKGVVKRGVVEVVTPGVSLSDRILDPKRSNYLAAVHATGSDPEDRAGLAWVDASTAEFQVVEAPLYRLLELIQSVAPAEVLVNREAADLVKTGDWVTTAREAWVFTEDFARETLLAHFGTHSLKGFGIDDLSAAVVAAGAALHYLTETQQGRLAHISKVSAVELDAHMALDPQTKRNLELVASMQGGSEGSLIAILDHTLTPMGGRMLRAWLLRPLKRVPDIQQRLDAVQLLVSSRDRRAALRSTLEPVGDIARISARAATGRASPRDLQLLRQTLARIPMLQDELANIEPGLLQESGAALDPMLPLQERLLEALADDPPATLKDGGVIRDGFDPDLDELRELARSGKNWLASMQEEEARRTGITSLKVGYNKVFGYYLEVTNAHKDKVPDTYIRKQTLVNAERYITPELKEFEDKILTAEERIGTLEAELFAALREQVADETPTLQLNAHLLGTLDSLCSLAEAASLKGYVCPQIHPGTRTEIVAGRHPVVESLLPPGEPFIPNTVRLDAESEQILVITGPNMAGKSVILRQVGLIVLLAQAGSFVPAESATIGLVDRIFTRVGASDNLSAGESTFLVEMNETANILNNATRQSLILLDEVGRGTSTFDGLSIAWSLVEYLHGTESVAARTLFATHYHELNELASHLERVRNFRVQVQEHDGRVIFLRRLVPGGADHSYGIEVARMAGLPTDVLERARQVLNHLEGQQLAVPGEQESQAASYPALPGQANKIRDPAQMSLFERDPVAEEVMNRLRNAETDRMTPLDALVLLSEMKSKLEA